MNRPHIKSKRWQNIILVVSLLLMTFPVGAIASIPPTELLLLTVQDDAQLQALAKLDLQVFEQITTSTGDMLVLMPAEPPQKETLLFLGFLPQILGEYHRLGENQPYLFYGLPQDLDMASQMLPFLWMHERLAFALTTPDVVQRIAAFGIQPKALHLKPFNVLEAKNVSLLSLSTPEILTPNPQVSAMLAQVSQSALYNLVGDFSGEWSVLINDSPYTLFTRYTYASTPITKATRLAYEKFLAMGLTSWYDYYYIGSGQYRNVLAQQTGLTQPDRVFLLTGHLDSTSTTPSTLAPGADDNASGSVALLTIADILRQYQFGCTLRYALFTGEEQGLYGSEAYASDPDPGSIQAVLNLDMLGYNTPNTAATIELHTRYANSPDLAIANLFGDVVSAYQIPLTPQILQDGLSFSDHASFWAEGYPAILAIEDWEDHTPYYHTTNDQLENLNMPYYTNFTKAALAAFAHMGCLIESGLTGKVSNASNGLPISGAVVEARLDAQQSWSTVTQADGVYSLNLQPGTYSIQITANGYAPIVQGNVVINSGQMTSLNFSLQPCNILSNTSLSISNTLPLLDEIVLFTGSSGGTLPIQYSWDFGDGATAIGPIAQHAFTQKGLFSIRMTASNLCSTVNLSSMVAVQTNLIYLPLVNRQN